MEIKQKLKNYCKATNKVVRIPDKKPKTVPESR
jgi:hypothetical protein